LYNFTKLGPAPEVGPRGPAATELPLEAFSVF